MIPSSPLILICGANHGRLSASASPARFPNPIATSLHHLFCMWFWQWLKWCTRSFLSVIPFVLAVSIFIFDVLDWVEGAVLQLSSEIVAPRVRETHRLSFLGIWSGKAGKLLWLAYISRVSLYHLSSSCPLLDNRFKMAALWQAVVPSSGMMSPARQMVFNFLYLLRILQTMLTISVPLWLVPSLSIA